MNYDMDFTTAEINYIALKEDNIYEGKAVLKNDALEARILVKPQTRG